MALPFERSRDEIRQWLSVCEHGNSKQVRVMLKQGFCVDSQDEDDNTALQVAAANGHETLVGELLMAGAALDLYNIHGWTALLHAARHGQCNVVSTLLKNHADINARTRLGASALMLASRGGHLKTCKLLIEAGIDLTPAGAIGATSYELNPLLLAAQFGHDSVLRYLLDRNFDINYRAPSTGMNALMLASQNGHMTTSQILIEREADPDLTNANGHTPLEIATIRDRRELMGYLDRKTKYKPQITTEAVKPDIIEAVKLQHLAQVQAILDLDLTQRDACSVLDGATPLMFAAMFGNLDIVILLVEKGCDFDKQDSISGWTALMQATFHGKKSVAKYLINAGANVLLPAKNGYTAFDLATMLDVDTELYRLLATRAFQVSQKENVKSGQKNGVNADQREEGPKTGLKAWWNRMSNRFRNLKLGRTFNMNSRRLTPMSHVQDEDDERSSSTLKNSTISKSVSSSPKSSPKMNSKSVSMNHLNSSSMMDSNLSYETILLETQNSVSNYSLDAGYQVNSIQDQTLKAIIPPFLPPPTFETERARMPPLSSRKSIGILGSTSTLTSTRPIMHPTLFLRSSMNNLATTSPNNSTNGGAKVTFNTNSISPSSSGGASNFAPWRTRAPSSASSSTLTAGSDLKQGRKAYHMSSESVFMPHAKKGLLLPSPSSANPPSSPMITGAHLSANLTSSGEVYTSPRRVPKSRSSRSTNSTLTPSPTPSPKPPSDGLTPVESATDVEIISPTNYNSLDELTLILKKLSLERYQAIFEEQEVDMEAFLTLTDSDLNDLGISQKKSRNQILSAITELQSGKGRERIQFQETMNQFQNNRSPVSPNKTYY